MLGSEPVPFFNGQLGTLRQHIHLSTTESDESVGQGEQGVILSPTYIVPGEMPRAALAQDDRSDGHGLSRIAFDPPKLRIAVPTVA